MADSDANSWRRALPTRTQNASGSIAALGNSGITSSTMPLARRSADRIPCRAAMSGPCDVVVQDRARTFRWQRREPAVLGREHPVGRDQRERAAAGALPEQ